MSSVLDTELLQILICLIVFYMVLTFDTIVKIPTFNISCGINLNEKFVGVKHVNYRFDENKTYFSINGKYYAVDGKCMLN